MNRDEILEAADHEGQLNVAVDELSGVEGELTIDDLKKLPGTEDMSDKDLLEMYEQVKNENKGGEVDSAAGGKVAEQVADALGGEAVQTARGWKVYDEKGVEIADLSKMTVNEFLKTKIGYNANSKEQRKSFDEMIRVAQYGHLNEQKLNSTKAERDAFAKQLEVIRPQFQGQTSLLNTVKNAITKYHLGDDKPLAQLLEAFKKQMVGDVPSMGNNHVDSGNDDAEAMGQRVWYETIQPMADKIAEEFSAGLNPDVSARLRTEVRKAVQQFTQDEPGETLTMQKIQHYIQQEIPFHLEGAGYKRGQNIQQPNTEVAALKAKIAQLETANKNSVVATVREKNKKIPSSGRSDVQNKEGETGDVPAGATKSAAEYRKFLRDS